MANSLDPDKDRNSVGPDLDPNRSQKLSADDKSTTSKKGVNLPKYFAWEMSSAHYACCIYSNALQSNFIIDANTMNPDQTAHKSLVWVQIVCKWAKKNYISRQESR